MTKLLFLALASILLASCNEAPQSLPEPTTSATPTGPCKGFDGLPTEPAPKDADADGRHATLLVAIDVDAKSVAYDVIQFLTGEEAKTAFHKDHPDEDGPPNDYYTVNENTMVRTSGVMDGACIAVFRSGDPKSTASLPDLAALLRVLMKEPKSDSGHLSDHVFWVTKSSGRITAIQQQWVP